MTDKEILSKIGMLIAEGMSELGKILLDGSEEVKEIVNGNSFK